MKIQKLKINGFGNLVDKQIIFKDKINIIQGANESGKSTLLKFIADMLYGASRNKKGKDISDFERYIPWETENYSGKLWYELEDGKKYEIYRDFRKKNPTIYNENLQDITEQFSIDKTKGNQFFYEQTKIEEEVFLSSIASMQQEVKIGEKEQINLIQKISNLAGTGDDSISFKKSIDKLNKRQLVEIGTQRSQDRPINRLMQEISHLEEEREKLDGYEDEKYTIEEQIIDWQEKLKEVTKKLQMLKEVKGIKDNIRIEKEKIKINEQLQNEFIKNIQNLKEKAQEAQEIVKEKEKKQQKNIVKKSNAVKYTLGMVISILLVILGILLIPSKIIKGIGIVLIPVILFLFIRQNKKQKRIEKNNSIIQEQMQKEWQESKVIEEKINREIELLQEKQQEKEEEIKKLNLSIDRKLEEELKKVAQNHQINNIFEIFDTNVELAIEQNTQQENEIKLQIHRLELDQKNIFPKLDNLSNIEEKLEKAKEELDSLKKKDDCIVLAKEMLEKAYQQMKQNITPKFSLTLSQIAQKISNGRYRKVRIAEEGNILVELEDGRYIPIELLSVGTIDQLYLALRIAVMKQISEETLPIILDESFAYYDEERLENVLRFIQEELNNQVIILTCTDREKSILDALGYEYQYNNLEKEG